MSELTKEQIEKLRVFLITLSGEGWKPSREGWGDDIAGLLALLDQHKPAPTDEPYNGPLSGRGVITDEERREMVSGKTLLEWMDCIQCCDAKADGFGCSEADRGHCAIAVERIRALIQSPPKASVTKEWLAKLGEHFIYIQIDEVKAMLAEKGIAVVVSEAVDSGEGKEGK